MFHIKACTLYYLDVDNISPEYLFGATQIDTQEVCYLVFQLAQIGSGILQLSS